MRPSFYSLRNLFFHVVCSFFFYIQLLVFFFTYHMPIHIPNTLSPTASHHIVLLHHLAICTVLGVLFFIFMYLFYPFGLVVYAVRFTPPRHFRELRATEAAAAAIYVCVCWERRKSEQLEAKRSIGLLSGAGTQSSIWIEGVD